MVIPALFNPPTIDTPTTDGPASYLADSSSSHASSGEQAQQVERRQQARSFDDFGAVLVSGCVLAVCIWAWTASRPPSAEQLRQRDVREAAMLLLQNEDPASAEIAEAAAVLQRDGEAVRLLKQRFDTELEQLRTLRAQAQQPEDRLLHRDLTHASSDVVAVLTYLRSLRAVIIIPELIGRLERESPRDQRHDFSLHAVAIRASRSEFQRLQVQFAALELEVVGDRTFSRSMDSWPVVRLFDTLRELGTLELHFSD